MCSRQKAFSQKYETNHPYIIIFKEIVENQNKIFFCGKICLPIV